MSASRRVQQEPAYILHHRPFRDTSQILDIVTRNHGRIAVVARGSRASRSRLAGVLRPFLPLHVSWVSKSDLGTLTGAEAIGPPVGVSGDALYSAYYINELLLHFLHRYDPQAEIFALYEEVVCALARTEQVAACLRSFELEFLSLLGYGVNLDHEAGSHESLNAQSLYQYRMQQGPVSVQQEQGPLVFKGMVLTGIAQQRFDEAEVLRAANRLLREVINFHLGGKELKSRRVLRELHRGRIAASKSTEDEYHE